ncbi:MAG: VapC toxin family PIN domain ribonuclease [Acidobacteriota bacterium]
MDKAETDGVIYVPSITIVELRYLVEKGKITEATFNLVMDAIAASDSALMVASLDSDTAKSVGSIARVIVPDMPDRIIAATAV